jgi:hypothetical protein
MRLSDSPLGVRLKELDANTAAGNLLDRSEMFGFLFSDLALKRTDLMENPDPELLLQQFIRTASEPLYPSKKDLAVAAQLILKVVNPHHKVRARHAPAAHDSPSAMRNPPSAMRNPPSAMRNPPSAMRNPPSAMRNPPQAAPNPPQAAREREGAGGVGGADGAGERGRDRQRRQSEKARESAFGDARIRLRRAISLRRSFSGVHQPWHRMMPDRPAWRN